MLTISKFRNTGNLNIANINQLQDLILARILVLHQHHLFENVFIQLIVKIFMFNLFSTFL